jgi:hypothetical protein
MYLATIIKSLDKIEGSVVKIHHFGSEMQSLIVYVTDKGESDPHLMMIH